jgi:hypothetical protein
LSGHESVRSKFGGVPYEVGVNVTGVAGFLLAKTAAARERRLSKDWYDIAFVLLRNDAGGPQDAARVMIEHFQSDLVGSIKTAIDELAANFDAPDAQGSVAYASQMVADYPDHDEAQLRTHAMLAVTTFYRDLFN